MGETKKPTYPRPFPPQIINPVQTGPGVSQEMISQILGHSSAMPGTLQHLLGVKNAMFSNFISSLYQAFLYGDNRVNIGIPENMNTYETSVPRKEIDEPAEDQFPDLQLDEVLEKLQTHNLTLSQQLWLKKRQKRMKRRIARTLLR